MVEFNGVKAVAIPEGNVKMITSGEDFLWKKGYTNLLPLAVDVNGNPYNGGLGYKTGYRVNSSKVEVEAPKYCCTGFIPVTLNDVVRIKNITISVGGAGYVHFLDQDRVTGCGVAYEKVMSETLAADGCYTFTPAELGSIDDTMRKTSYMRISTGVIDENTIITVNEEIE